MIPMRSRKVLIIATFLFFFMITTSFVLAQNSEFRPLGFFGKLKLLPQLGFRKTLTVIMTPPEKDDRGYHNFVYDLNCEAPNYWVVPETDNPVCSNPQAQALGIRCGESCPPERRVGPVCPQGHFCCRPADTPPPQITIIPTKSPCTDAAGHTIQYCDIKF